MKIPVIGKAESNEKYVVRCFGAALVLQMILHLVRWAVLSAIGIGILALFQHVIGYVIALPIQGIAKIILTVVVYAFPVRLYLRMTERKLSDIVRPRGNTEIYRAEQGGMVSKILFFVFAAAITVVVTNFVGMVTDEVYHDLGLMPSVSDIIPHPLLVILSFISSVIVAPIMEEALFRGVAVNALAPYGMKRTVLISGVLFALMHHSAYALFYAFFAGCLIAFFTYVSGSLRVAIGLHFVNNLLTFTVTAVRGFEGLAEGEQISGIFMNLALPIAIVGVVYFLKKRIWRISSNGGGSCGEPDGSQSEALGGGNRGEPDGSQSEALGGGSCGEPDGGQNEAVLGSPICAGMVIYAVFAAISCFW